MEKVKCPFCQKEIPIGQKECPLCFHNLSGIELQPFEIKGGNTYFANNPYKTENQKRKVFKNVIVIVLVVGLLVAGYIGIKKYYAIDYSKYTEHLENDEIEYTEGNYSDHKCEWPIDIRTNCDKPCVCEFKFKDGSDSEYYCPDHRDYAKSFNGLVHHDVPSFEPLPDYYITVDPDTDNDNFWLGVTTAQELVKDELKSPSTAKFSYDESTYTVKKSGNKWIVTGYVDAQNGFGATVRERWTATFTITGLTDYNYNVKNYEVTFS